MKVALVHDWLITYGGGERVLEALHEMYPLAPVYTAFKDERALGRFAKKFEGWDIRESWFSKVPFRTRLASALRFLTPLVWESFDFSEYEVVVTSSAWYNPKGIITGPGTLHICYLHTPPRYLYGYKISQAWMKYWPVRVYAAVVNKFLRKYDFLSSKRVDFFVVNSTEVQKRVKKFYRREAVVIPPPVEIKSKEDGVKSEQGEYFLTGGRLMEAKNFDLVIKAVNRMGLRLKVFGSGSDEGRLRKLAGGKVEFLGRVSEEELAGLYRGAKAFIAAASDEDFGMTLVEANACGAPVLAYKGGGYVDIVKEGINGVFFDELTVEELVEGINKIQHSRFNIQKIKKSAERFGKENFKRKMRKFVEEKYREAMKR